MATAKPGSDIKFVTLINARQGGLKKRIPVSPVVNNGLGIQHYLAKKDEVSGKQVYYLPDAWAAMGEQGRKVAMDFSPVENDDTRRMASQLMNAFISADPLARKAVAEMVAQELAASQPAPASSGKGGR